MVRLAIEFDNRFKASSIEFEMPRPSYTITTLTYLTEKYPQNKFCLIMGADNLATLHKWKNHEQILKGFEIYVYPRKETTVIPKELQNHSSVHLTEAPVMELSSTFIRKAIKENKNIKHMLPHQVADYVKEMHFYEK
jgi:nicotinate-nucleotide adenylyltransferase